MFLKHFSTFGKRVPDPLRPGRTAVVHELRDSGASVIVFHGRGQREEFTPGDDGWFKVPDEVGVVLCHGRSPSGWYQPHEVEEERRLGRIDEPVARPAVRRQRPSADS